MNTTFYIAGAVAILATFKAITGVNAVRALLYLIVSLFAVGVVFFTLGAPFAAALEVITYAGAIMVLFVFVIMMLNLGPSTIAQEKRWLPRAIWAGPSLLALVLFVELGIALFSRASRVSGGAVSEVTPSDVGAALFGPYALGAELASMLLLSGLVGAYHLGAKTVIEQKTSARAEALAERKGAA